MFNERTPTHASVLSRRPRTRRRRAGVAMLGLAAAAVVLVLAAFASRVSARPSDAAQFDIDDIRIIDHVRGKRGAVRFTHREHVQSVRLPAGGDVTCRDCHHTMRTPVPRPRERVESCTFCHAEPGRPQPIRDAPPLALWSDELGRYPVGEVLMHRSCLDACHQPVATATGDPIAACAFCHGRPE